MGNYSAEEIAEIVPLLHEADQRKPNWLVFEADNPSLVKRLTFWLTHNEDSPLGWASDDKPARKYIIEWLTPAGWSTDVKRPGVLGEYGRIGRIRFRIPRTQEGTP